MEKLETFEQTVGVRLPDDPSQYEARVTQAVATVVKFVLSQAKDESSPVTHTLRVRLEHIDSIHASHMVTASVRGVVA